MPGSPPHYRGKNIGQNQDDFHGYPPPSPGVGAWLQITGALEEHVTPYDKGVHGRVTA